jgi:hypothetical protein
MRVIFLLLSFVAITVLSSDELLSLDLSRFVGKLTKNHAKYFPNSTVAENGIAEYKKFLVLIKNHPKASLTPSYIIDEVWHSHILDTKAYAKICEKFFGKFLHHNPGFGESVEEHKVFDNQYSNTLKLYRKKFGEPPAYFWPSNEGGLCTKKLNEKKLTANGDPTPSPTPASCGNCGANGCSSEVSSAGDPTPTPTSTCGNCGANGCSSKLEAAADPTPTPTCGTCGANGCSSEVEAPAGGSDPTPSPTPASCGNCGANGCSSEVEAPAGDPTPSPTPACGNCGANGCSSEVA